MIYMIVIVSFDVIGWGNCCQTYPHWEEGEQDIKEETEEDQEGSHSTQGKTFCHIYEVYAYENILETKENQQRDIAHGRA